MIEPFVIASIAAPPGRIGICRLPGRGGELATDVATIGTWRPSIVVSLTEQGEMDELGARGLQAMLARIGVAWRHFPVEDYGAPTLEREAAWRVVANELHAAIDAGQSVLLHCRGGLGRSGMAAARLLAERTGDAADALAQVRRERPGAVETAGQATWICAGVRRSPPPASVGKAPRAV